MEKQKCSKCKIEKPLDEYERDRTKRHGRRHSCKACRSMYNKSRRRVADTAYQARWRAENRDYWVNYRSENPHKNWEGGYRARAKKFDFEPVIESFTRDELIARWGDECFHCGGGWSEIDHYPVSVIHGGTHTLDNARPSCLKCNRRSWRETA